ncbi:putative DNA topoisomerase type I [Parapoxvirus red deer/HL953]|uniref:DNA topoisomerase n=1 Tax=Parapoxvirus red deer/HL953 TaxID=1579460 RepID=A0A0A7MA89_9POXV|nr:putative DNA topoisomerase type I [Parapoxvirus red deer/HL953]AIZ77313.1 putative DNA topoisomerase type I [Parapoxvirus red deer/HL953]
MRALYLREGKLFIDAAGEQPAPEDSPAYEVLAKVRIPPHLSDVVVYEQTLAEAARGLIFVGRDAKGRKQYFYGREHVQRRNAVRNTVFVRVHRVMESINAFIDSNLASGSASAAQMAAFLLMETSFFIRIGKTRYEKESGTVGMLTLRNKHLCAAEGGEEVRVRFVGKDRVQHEFAVRRGQRLFAALRRLWDPAAPERLLFDRLSERRVYAFMRRFGIRVKDLRTYGVNYTFLYNFWSNVRAMDPRPSVKSLICTSVRQTAETVGHTPSISRSAYMATAVLELVRDGTFLDRVAATDSLDEFVNSVVDYVNVNNSEVVNE